MSDLDKKLEDELAYYAENYHPEHEYNIGYRAENLVQTKELIMTIRQAFIDAGWVEMYKPDYHLLSSTTKSSTEGMLSMKVIEEYMDNLNKETALSWNSRHEYMSGREWYDRFQSELEKVSGETGNQGGWIIHDLVDSAAWKATNTK